MYFVLVCGLSIMLCISYYIGRKELCNPAFLFTFSFFSLSIFGLVNYKEVDFDLLSAKTMFVILTGVLSFSCGCWLVSKIMNETQISPSRICLFLKVTNFKLVFFLVFQIITLILTYRVVITFGPNDISSALGTIRNDTVNNGVGILPKYLSAFNQICYMAGIFMSILVARILLGEYNSKTNSVLIIANFLVTMVISLSGGSRGTLLIILSSLVLNYILFYYEKNDWKVKIRFVSIVKGFILAYISLYGFKELSLLMGQMQVADFSFSQYIFVYIGAQLKNLDIALNQNTISLSSEVFGQETFRTFVNFFSNLFGTGKYGQYDLYLPFRYYKGISLGNVATTFFPYIKDFGYIGGIICPFIMGIVSQFLYCKTKNYLKRYDGISIWNMIWSIAGFCIIFSFFSNKFYENIISMTIINYVLFSFLVLFFFCGVPISSSGRIKNDLW